MKGGPFSKGGESWQHRSEFPALAQSIHGHPLLYLDNAATTQKPREVLDAITQYYERDNANVHRGVHTLSERATVAFEAARKEASLFLKTSVPEEIVFTRGTTESINLVAQSWGPANLGAGDRIALTEMEHHSNLVPWQLVAERTGAKILYVPVIASTGELDMEEVVRILDSGVKLFAFTHVSNTLGTVNPVQELCEMARSRGVVTLVDAAQSAGHRPLDVQQIGCDFLACSGHKMCGPMGIGLLYGRHELLESLPPWQGGGEMISRVTYEVSTWARPPHKFEAGTPNVEGAIGLSAAMDFLERVDRERIRTHDQELVRHAWEVLSEIPGIRLFGPPPNSATEHAGALSFTMEGVHAHDIVTLADQDGIALRGGHHCNQPLMKKLGVPSTARASFYFYNLPEEIERLANSLRRILRLFGKLGKSG